MANEAAGLVIRKFGMKAAEIGVETLTRKIETLAIKHGDEAFLAVRKVGPRVFRIVEDAGEHGLQSIKLMAKFGDEAIWVVGKPNRMAIFVKFGDNAAEAMMKHGEIAEPLLQSIGKPAAGALKAVSRQNGRRLAIIAKNGKLTEIGKMPELLDVITNYGDRAMDFIWRNQDSLAVADATTTFLANPEPFLNGTMDIGQAASQGAKATNWTVVALSPVGIVGLLFGIRLWLKYRPVAKQWS